MASKFIGTNTFIHTLTSAHTSLVTVYRSIGVQESSVRYLKTINNLLTQNTRTKCEVQKKKKKIHGNDTNKTHLKAPNTATVTQITHTQPNTYITQVMIVILWSFHSGSFATRPNLSKSRQD